MLRVLFVDDDRLVLNGLRRGCRRFRDKWDMTFVDSGEIALGELENGLYDVLVTDMRMPLMSGAELLAQVQSKHENVLRLVLSGYAEQEHVARAVHTAHQFLSKPCEMVDLESAIDSACALRHEMANPALLRIVGKIDQLPSVPRLYASLVSELADPNSSPVTVATIIEQDPAMSAKLLQVVSSAFFVTSAPVQSVKGAVSRLGFEAVRNLVLGIEAFQSDQKRVGAATVEQQQRHAFKVARLAARAAESKEDEQNAFLAGLLHDIGENVFAMSLSSTWKELNKRAPDPGDRFGLEAKVMGATHADVGAYLLGMWGLPYAIVSAVLHHHRPSEEAQPQPLTLAVHLADAVASRGELNEVFERLDPALIDRPEVLELCARLHEHAADEGES